MRSQVDLSPQTACKWGEVKSSSWPGSIPLQTNMH
jgi:hypothetical protein